jgi:hypothetical protein
MSYGYSIWYVPYNYIDLKNKYDMKHIPHITIKTNLMKQEAIDFFQEQIFSDEAYIYVHDPLVIFPDIYDTNPLKAIGWWCSICSKASSTTSTSTTIDSYASSISSLTESDIDNEWKPHLSIEYFTELPKYLIKNIKKPTESLLCFKVIADTTYMNPEEWKLL